MRGACLLFIITSKSPFHLFCSKSPFHHLFQVTLSLSLLNCSCISRLLFHDLFQVTSFLLYLLSRTFILSFESRFDSFLYSESLLHDLFFHHLEETSSPRNVLPLRLGCAAIEEKPWAASHWMERLDLPGLLGLIRLTTRGEQTKTRDEPRAH